jgi:polyhydroxybutyrate depolymerase
MRLIALFALLCLCAAPASARLGDILTVDHDGLERRAIIDRAPEARDAPLLVVLHGGIGSASMVRRRAGVRLWREGWVVAYPEAIDDWNDGRVYPSGDPVSTVDDVGFLRTMITDLAARGLVDPEQVFVAGPSIGGMMALRVLCDAPDLVAGVAVAIASLPVGADCPDGPARPFILIHGTEDEIVPPGGGRIGGNSIFIRERGSVRPIDETVSLITARNACDAVRETPLPDRAPDDGTVTIRRSYLGCAEPFEHFVVEGGGHTWPGDRPFRLGRSLVGATSQDFSATRLVENFFSALTQAP